MSDGDASQASKRQRTGPSTMAVVLNEALEVVETLVEEGHVNAHAHNQIAKALKRVNDVEVRDRDKIVRDAVLKLVAECGFTLGPVMCADLGDIGVFETKFIRKLFSRRFHHIEPKPCTAFTTEWIQEVLEFYVPPPSQGEAREDLHMQRDMILALLQAAPQGVDIVNDLLKHLEMQKIAPRMLVDDSLDETSSTYWETNGWLEEVLDCAPELVEWAAPESDTSDWADEVRCYAHVPEWTF